MEAVRLAKRQLAINPDEVYALSTMLVAGASAGDLESYRRAKDRTLEMWSGDPQAHYDIAVAASRLGEMAAASDAARQALDLGYPVALLRADPDISASGVEFD